MVGLKFSDLKSKTTICNKKATPEYGCRLNLYQFN
jgi:hypothetical protein